MDKHNNSKKHSNTVKSIEVLKQQKEDLYKIL